jgi:hypothetical protein
LPAKIPVTTPLTLIDAVAGAELLHTPLPVTLDNVVVPSTQVLSVPVIAATVGNAFTVTTADDIPIHPEPLVTV